MDTLNLVYLIFSKGFWTVLVWSWKKESKIPNRNLFLGVFDMVQVELSSQLISSLIWNEFFSST